jgi:hypothetical protein
VCIAYVHAPAPVHACYPLCVNLLINLVTDATVRNLCMQRIDTLHKRCCINKFLTIASTNIRQMSIYCLFPQVTIWNGNSSFVLSSLVPYSRYNVSVECIPIINGTAMGYWSDSRSLDINTEQDGYNQFDLHLTLRLNKYDCD